MRLHGNSLPALLLILLVVPLVPIAMNVQGSTIQLTATQLETQLQVATSSRNYATTIVDSATSQGLNTTTFQALLVTGNASLAAAMADLSANTNLSAGIESAQSAMSDFTSAAQGASLLLVNSKSDYYLEAAANLDSIKNANNTLTELSAAVSIACSTAPTNSSYASQFDNYCASENTYLSLATADLKQAEVTLSTAGTIGSAEINESQSLITNAKGNISLAANVISKLSQFTYSSRVHQYIAGPLAKTMSTANATVKDQSSMASNFNADIAQYQTFNEQQATEVNNVVSSATSLATSISTTLTATTAVSTQITAENSELTTAASDMSTLSSLVNSFPSTLVGNLPADIIAVQSDISASTSSLGTLYTQASSFNQLSLTSLASYSATFQNEAGNAESDNAALLSSLQTLKTDLGPLALGLNLVAWVNVLNSLSTSLASYSSSLSMTTQTVQTDLESSQSALASYKSTLQSSSGIEVSSTLVNGVASIYSSESAYLNATALAQLQAASTSIETTSQESAGFVTQLQAISSATVSEVSTSVQSLSSASTTLGAQAATAFTAMNSAYTFLSLDLQIRTQALASANSDILAAVAMFNDLQISQGVSLLAQANVQLQIAMQAS